MPLPINCICQFAYLHKFLAALIPSFSILIPTCIHFAPSTCVSDTRYHHFSHMHRFEVHALRVDACMRIPSISFTFMANYIVCAVPHPTRQQRIFFPFDGLTIEEHNGTFYVCNFVPMLPSFKSPNIKPISHIELVHIVVPAVNGFAFFVALFLSFLLLLRSLPSI